MFKSLLSLVLSLWITEMALSQDFTFHSNNPFQIQLMTDDSSSVALRHLFADRDRDGDLDLFLIGFRWDTSGIQTVFHMDYFIRYQENIGTKNNPMFGPHQLAFENFTFPFGTFVPAIGDLNDDGYLDIVAAAQVDPVLEDQHLVFYINKGLPEDEFEFILADSFNLSPLDPRSFSTPEIADFDMDGDQDIMLSAYFPLSLAFEEYQDIVFYAKNTGTVQEPSYLGWFDSPYGLGQDLVYETLKAGDIDYDGDVDILSIAAGLDSLTPIGFYRNTPGSNGKPAFEAKVFSPFGLPEADEGLLFVDMNMADIDGDLDLDIFLITITAEGSIALQYYENTSCISQTTVLDEQLCEGESVTIGGMEFFDTGDYVITLTGSNGCDSIIQLHLQVDAVYEEVLAEELCEGDVFIIGGQEYATTGDYVIPFTSAEGCDSIVQLHLQVFPVYEIFLSEVLCAGDVFYIGGQDFTTSGIYQVVLTSLSGCDSIIHAELQFESVDASVTQAGTQLSANLTGANYQWIDCNTGLDIAGAVDRIFEPEVSGTYAVIIIDQNGCAGTSPCFTVIVTGVRETDLSASIRIHPNPATTHLYIENTSGLVIEALSIYARTGEILMLISSPVSTVILLEDLQAGIYMIEIDLGTHMVLLKLAVVHH